MKLIYSFKINILNEERRNFRPNGGTDGFDSDEEVQQKKTKTQVKKEKAAIAETATAAPAKKLSNAEREKRTQDGFEIIDQGRPQTAQPRGRGGDRGGRGRGGDRPQTGRGGRGGDRGGRGRGGNRGGGDRGGRGRNEYGQGQSFRGAPRKRPDGLPQTEARGNKTRLDADGNEIAPAGRPGRDRNTGDEGGQHGGYDKRDGTGRARRGGKAGSKFGEGDAVDRQYQRKGQDASGTGEEQAEETKEESKEPAEQEVEVIYGVSFDDYFKENARTGAKQGRDAQGVSKDTKVEANTKAKEYEQTTKLKNTTAYNVAGKGAMDVKDNLNVGF